MSQVEISRHKQQLAAEAFRRIASKIERAPIAPNRDATADDIMESLFDGYCGEPFHRRASDPTATDGYLDFCSICESEAHDGSCPILVLETIYKIGIWGTKALPLNVGLP